MSNDRVLLVNPDGTASTIDQGSLDALAAYVKRCKDEGITWSLGCGCARKVVCGYHREQTQRIAANLAALRAKGSAS